MFSLTIVFGSTSWRLLYKDEKKAEEHYSFAKAPIANLTEFNPSERFELTDEFGQRATFRRSDIMAVMFENLDESKLGTIEYALHQMRTQVSGQQRAEHDPTLRAARRGTSPSIVSPMGPNGQAFS